jgi:Papain family cysteine protease/IPT/TIG domain
MVAVNNDSRPGTTAGCGRKELSMPRAIHRLALGWVTVTAAAAAVLPVGPAAAAGTEISAVHPVGALPTAVKIPARIRIGVSAHLPTSVDLRAGAPPVGDQGNVGSCVAWSIGYSLTGYYARTIRSNGAPYAPLYLYMRTVRGKPGPTGLYPSAALRNERNEGIDTQAHYWQGTTNIRKWPTRAQIRNAANYRITGWTTLFSGVQRGTAAQTVLKQSLAAGTPVSISIPVYRGFDRITSMTPYRSTAGPIRGYHMITAYGYDEQGLIIRNSWGTWWGKSGDAKLAWSFVNSKVTSAYTITGVRANGRTSVGKPRVTGLSATKAGAGTTITITGVNLASATRVMFGSAPAEFTNVTTADGATALAAVVPPQPVGRVDVTVSNGTGTSRASAAVSVI